MAINIKDFLYLVQEMFQPKKYEVDTKNPKKIHISYDMRDAMTYKVSLEIHNDRYEFVGENEDILFKDIIEWLATPEEEREIVNGVPYVDRY